MGYSNTGNYTQVAGAITAAPGGTIASATWNSIFTDLGTSIAYNIGGIVAVARQVTFSVSVTDFQMQVVLPTNFTRFRPLALEISNPTGAANLSTATVTLFTAAAAGGTQVVTSTAVTITTSSGNTNNNAQTLTPGQIGTIAVSASTVYFRVMAASTGAAAADIILFAQPVS